jgi:hypothetical protein
MCTGNSLMRPILRQTLQCDQELFSIASQALVLTTCAPVCPECDIAHCVVAVV